MRKILTSLFVFIFVFFIFSVTNTFAKVISNDKGSVNIAKSEVVNDDLFIGAQTVEIDGTVNGDVFVGAQTVKVTGIINGNLHVGTNSLILSGTVKGNVYAGAQNVMVSGSLVGGSLLIGAATINIDKDSSVGGSILAGAGTLSVDSQVKRSVYAGTGSLTIGSDAKIGKDLYYATGNNPGQVNISDSAKIAGSIYKSELNTPQGNINTELAKKQTRAVFGKVKIVASFISLIGALIIGFIYLKLFEKHFIQSASLVSKSFWKTFGIGFLVTIAFIPGVIVLIITVIGIPVAGVATLILLLYSYLAKIIVGFAFGNWISQKFGWKMTKYEVFALGILVIYIIRLIPAVGFLTGIIVLWVGLGALTLRMLSKSE